MARYQTFILLAMSSQSRGLTTCPGFPGFCSESFPGQSCLVVCDAGRNNVPLCQDDGSWTDIPRCVEHEPGVEEQIPGLCPGISGYCSTGFLHKRCQFDCTFGPKGRARNRTAEALLNQNIVSDRRIPKTITSGGGRKNIPSFAGNINIGPLPGRENKAPTRQQQPRFNDFNRQQQFSQAGRQQQRQQQAFPQQTTATAVLTTTKAAAAPVPTTTRTTAAVPTTTETAADKAQLTFCCPISLDNPAPSATQTTPSITASTKTATATAKTTTTVRTVILESV